MTTLKKEKLQTALCSAIPGTGMDAADGLQITFNSRCYVLVPDKAFWHDAEWYSGKKC